MRLRLAHFALCSSLLIGQQLSQAQHDPCTSTQPTNEPPAGPEISINNVTFSGFIQLPIPDQDEITASLKRQKYTSSLDSVAEEALERVKAGWQDHGYFKAEVSGEAKKLSTTTAAMQQIALFVHVQENAQYHLGGITFKDNRVLTDSAKLRDLFPIKNGEIFSRKKIATGLENLKSAYGQYGYINYTGVPSTTFKDEKKKAYLEIDVDEGKLFYISRINVEGVGAPPKQQVLDELALRPGDIYNSRLWDLSLERVASVFSKCVCRSNQTLELDERAGTVAVTVGFGPCS